MTSSLYDAEFDEWIVKEGLKPAYAGEIDHVEHEIVGSPFEDIPGQAHLVKTYYTNGKVREMLLGETAWQAFFGEKTGQ